MYLSKKAEEIVKKETATFPFYILLRRANDES